MSKNCHVRANLKNNINKLNEHKMGDIHVMQIIRVPVVTLFEWWQCLRILLNKMSEIPRGQGHQSIQQGFRN